MKEYGFEHLDIWKISTELVIDIYQTSNKFPESERYGLISQIRRAVISIPSNIAEGNSRLGSKDKKRFIQIAYSSCIEVLNHLLISQKLGMVEEAEIMKYRVQINELTNKLNAFYKNVPDNK